MSSIGLAGFRASGRQFGPAWSILQRNRIWARRLGWYPQRRRIARLIGAGSGGAAPGAFVAALRRWQRANGLPASGVLGPATWRRMQPETGPGEEREWSDVLAATGSAAACDLAFRPNRKTPRKKWRKPDALRLRAFRKKYGPAYRRWVLASISAATGSQLAVDPSEDSAALRSAIRDFQKSMRLSATGEMNGPTEAALILRNGCRPPWPEVSEQLPASGKGFATYMPKENRRRQYGLPQTIAALRAIGKRWAESRHDGSWIAIGDLSLQGGGCTDRHDSHQMGIDVDIRLRTKKGGKTVELANWLDKAHYSPILIRELVHAINNNGVLPVDLIYFNDPDLAPSVRERRHHDNHLHVRFKVPPGLWT